jgi:hypothetical protein
VRSRLPLSSPSRDRGDAGERLATIFSSSRDFLDGRDLVLQLEIDREVRVVRARDRSAG